MPACFDNWCRRFDDVFRGQKQREGFKVYLGGLLGESERKNLTQMAHNTVNGSYNSLRHFLNAAPWEIEDLNNQRLKVMNQCRQTKLVRGYSLIIDDSGHRKSGSATAGVGRQYIGQVGKTDNGVVFVSSHYFDGVKSVPLDVKLYQHATSLPEGKQDPNFQTKPTLALQLIEQCLERGLVPAVVLIDAGYGNNTPFLKQLEGLQLRYIASLAKNRRVLYRLTPECEARLHRLDEIAAQLPPSAWTAVTLPLPKPRTVWVAQLYVEIPNLGQRWIAIQLNAPTLEAASDVDYFVTNAALETLESDWMVKTYSQRNWVEVFYREAKGWLGLCEYQVRDAKSLKRHWTLVFTAYTFLLWHQLTGGIRRRWASKPLQTFVDVLEAFRGGSVSSCALALQSR
jgi:SRSO17 transposase